MITGRFSNLRDSLIASTLAKVSIGDKMRHIKKCPNGNYTQGSSFYRITGGCLASDYKYQQLTASKILDRNFEPHSHFSLI